MAAGSSTTPIDIHFRHVSLRVDTAKLTRRGPATPVASAEVHVNLYSNPCPAAGQDIIEP